MSALHAVYGYAEHARECGAISQSRTIVTIFLVAMLRLQLFFDHPDITSFQLINETRGQLAGTLRTTGVLSLQQIGFGACSKQGLLSAASRLLHLGLNRGDALLRFHPGRHTSVPSRRTAGHVEHRLLEREERVPGWRRKGGGKVRARER